MMFGWYVLLLSVPAPSEHHRCDAPEIPEWLVDDVRPAALDAGPSPQEGSPARPTVAAQGREARHADR